MGEERNILTEGLFNKKKPGLDCFENFQSVQIGTDVLKLRKTEQRPAQEDSQENMLQKSDGFSSNLTLLITI